MTTEPEPLTAAQVAPLLRATPRSVRRWARAGEFPGAMLIHGRWLFPTSVVTEYLRRHEIPAQ